jgi:acyl carrier protein
MAVQETGIFLESVRAAISDALGDGRLDDASADTSLVRSGLISSLEIVSVTLALENAFGISISPTQVTVANFDTLASLTGLVQRNGSAEFGASAAADGAEWFVMRASVIGVVRRPLLFAVLALATLVGLDFGLGTLMKGPLARSYDAFMESGHRLYPVGGAYSQDDLDYAVSQHRILRPSSAATGPRVAFFGDSGTIGSFVRYEDAIPHAVEDALLSRHPGAQTYNLAFFMQFLAKDLMILESVMERSDGRIPFDVAIFTLGDFYFRNEFILHLESAMPYLSLNWPLLERFATRISEPERAPFQQMTAELKTASRRARNPLEEFLQRRSALYRYAPYFRYLVTEVLLRPSPFFYLYGAGRKPLFDPVPPTPPSGFDMSLGIPDELMDKRIEGMARAAISYLHARGIKVILFLKPHGPNEWQAKQKRLSATTAKEIAERLCQGGICRVIDLRWELSGREFTDTTAHYTAAANRRIGEKIAQVVEEQLAQ